MRVALGVIAGFAACGAVVWFGLDVIRWLAGSSQSMSVITHLALGLLAIVSGLQVGSLVALGRWMEDSTWPASRSLWLLIGCAAVFVLSVLPYS